MIRLDTTNRKLQAVLAGAVTTNQLPCIVCYSDDNGSTYVGATQITNTNSTTPVDICNVPGASTVRDIDHISIRNRDTAAATITLNIDDTGTDYEIIKATLAVGDELIYTHGSGWHVITTNGQIKTALSTTASAITNVPAGNIAATDVQAAINELDTEKAALAGLSTQTFSVAQATSDAHAVRFDQSPNYCAFSAFQSSNALNVTGDNTTVAVIADTELYDVGADYNASTGVFTAPITGKYSFSAQVMFDQLTIDTHYIDVRVISTSRTAVAQHGVVAGTVDIAVMNVDLSLTAGDTVYVSANAQGGTKTVDISGHASIMFTFFAGKLIAR